MIMTIYATEIHNGDNPARGTYLAKNNTLVVSQHKNATENHILFLVSIFTSYEIVGTLFGLFKRSAYIFAYNT